MYAYKGFEPDLSCRGYRFVMGKNVTPEANCASNGFHCAEDPLDCLSYYGDMNRSIYCLVQPGGDIDEDDRDSSECDCKKDEKPTTSKESYFINGKSVDKSEFDKKYEEFEEKYLDNIRDMMLNYCTFMDEMDDWRSKLFRW